MQKEFSYIKGARLLDVLSVALGEDEGSSTIYHRYIDHQQRLWLVRRLYNDQFFRYLECFEFRENEKQDWGFRGWSEEECIPFIDCPLDILSQTSGPIKRRWRLAVLAFHGTHMSIPRLAWIHSISGVKLPNGAIEHDFQYLEGNEFRGPDGAVYRLKPVVVGRIMQEGFGIAAGRS